MQPAFIWTEQKIVYMQFFAYGGDCDRYENAGERTDKKDYGDAIDIQLFQ